MSGVFYVCQCPKCGLCAVKEVRVPLNRANYTCKLERCRSNRKLKSKNRLGIDINYWGPFGLPKEASLQFKRNICKSLVRPSNRILNKVRSSTSESPEHIAKKEEICGELEKKGQHYVTEAIFIKGGRADIFVLDTFTAIEIVKTETEESIARKRINYPEGVKIEVVRC